MPEQEIASVIKVDPASCPSAHSTANKSARLLWQLVWLCLFRPSPWFLHGWRRMLLRLFGASVGAGAKVMPSVRVWAPWNLSLGDYAAVSHGVDLYAVDRITIGSHATVSQRSFLCTASHDIDHPHMPLVTAPIVIGDGAWVCAEAYVHPGVRIGVNAVAAARSVVLHEIPSGQVFGGHPARLIRERRIGKGAGA